MRIIAFIQSNAGLPLYTDDILIESNTYNEVRAQIALMPYYLCIKSLDVLNTSAMLALEKKIKELKKGAHLDKLINEHAELKERMADAQEFLDADVSIILVDDKRSHQEIICKIKFYDLFLETEKLYSNVIKLEKTDWSRRFLHELDPALDAPAPAPVPSAIIELTDLDKALPALAIEATKQKASKN